MADISHNVVARFLTAGMAAGKWYFQSFQSSSDELYFHALTEQKNGGWAGVLVPVDSASTRAKPKAKKYSVRNSQLWKETKDVPRDVVDAEAKV